LLCEDKFPRLTTAYGRNRLIWLRAGDKWLKLEPPLALAYKIFPNQGSCFPFPQQFPVGQAVNVLLRGNGVLGIQAGGYRWGPRDNYMRQPWPGFLAGGLSYLFGDLGDGTVPIGEVFEEFNQASNWGIGVIHKSTSTNGDFTLYYRIEEVARYGGSLPTELRK
jgi:hypothetical protein